jgi:recombination protein RecT
VHVPAKSNRGNPTHYYAMFKTKDGGYGFQVMSVEDVQNHARRFSKSFGSGPWQTNFDEMAKKTVLKKVLKYAPLKSDFVRGIAQDETIKHDLSDDMADIPDVTDYTIVDEATGEVLDSSAMDRIDNDI